MHENIQELKQEVKQEVRKSSSKPKNVKFKQEQEDAEMQNEESNDLDMLTFSQFVESKFKILDEEEDDFLVPVT